MNIKIVIKKKINGFIKYLYRLFYKLIPIQKKTFLFVAYHGRGYLCNPKAIHEYMSQCEAYHDYQFIWALKKDHYVDIPNAKVIRYNSLQFFYYLARSKYWIFNCKMPAYLMKKKDQIYLQTWHGTPLKKLAHDINIGPSATFYRSQVTKDQMTKSYDIDRQRYDYFLSPSAFATEKFISSFQLNLNQILEVGYPRNDFLTNITEEKIRQLKQKYNLPQDKKIILYAPTWRDNSYNSKGYTYEIQVDFKYWKSKLYPNYAVLFKPHYLITNQYEYPDLNNFLYFMKEDTDINELYVISDVLITDYSSVFFDFAILRRPILFYMYDLEEYKENIRGFYLDVPTDLPGEVITEEDELIHRLENLEIYFHQYIDKLKNFNQVYNSYQDGMCSKKVVEAVIDLK